MSLTIRRVRAADGQPPDRSALPDPGVTAAAASVVDSIRTGGDVALSEASRRFGGGPVGTSPRIPPATLAEALRSLDAPTIDALSDAIANVRTVHAPQRPVDTTVVPADGVTVERRWTPLSSVGVYVPGGRAIYPSSLIMGVVPARVAGVERIVVATPARADGTIDPIVLATAALLDVDEVYAMGGAQAVAALAYGTETIDRVDKIVGPGGPWVTAAKMLVYGAAGVDLPAGPSESAVIADASADPRLVAANVMCQAEHGEESAVVLACVGIPPDAVIAEIESTLPTLERADTIAKALTDHGLVVECTSLDEAARWVDAWAPEHLSIHTVDDGAVVDAIPNAGSVFVGRWTPEAAGDYATGANHVLPTGGLARAYGPLDVETFGSWRQVQTLTESGLRRLASTITTIAEREGLTAHAYSVTSRLESP